MATTRKGEDVITKATKLLAIISFAISVIGSFVGGYLSSKAAMIKASIEREELKKDVQKMSEDIEWIKRELMTKGLNSADWGSNLSPKVQSDPLYPEPLPPIIPSSRTFAILDAQRFHKREHKKDESI